MRGLKRRRVSYCTRRRDLSCRAARCRWCRRSARSCWRIAAKSPTVSAMAGRRVPRKSSVPGTTGARNSQRRRWAEAACPARAKDWPSLDRNFDVASWNSTAHGGQDHGNRVLDAWPTCGEENDDRQRASRQVLLVLEVRVRCDEDLELGSLCSGDELAVLQTGPATLVGCFNEVTDQCSTQRGGRALVEQDLHSSHCQRTACSVLQNGARLLERYARKPLDELVNGRVVLEVFEERGHGNSRAAEDPGAAYTGRVTLNSSAGGPVDHGCDASTRVVREG